MPDAWYNSFLAFWEDVREGYGDNLTIDRVDNNKPYGKDNVRWTTPKEQLRNTRVNVHVNTPWGRVTVAEAAERAGLKYITVYKRYRRGEVYPQLLTPV